jgi:hypothetical protein
MLQQTNEPKELVKQEQKTVVAKQEPEELITLSGKPLLARLGQCDALVAPFYSAYR